jgi:outer membrane protein OmpA-like peptidoglycan-associated protein
LVTTLSPSGRYLTAGNPLHHLYRFLSVVILVFVASCRPYMGPVNAGREYGSPKLPFFITHIAEKNQRMLRKGNIPKHHVFNKILCFKFACRNEARRNKSLHAISYKKFKKKVEKNAKQGEYKDLKPDSTVKKKPVKKTPPKPVLRPDTLVAAQPVPEPAVKRDTLVVLSEFSFEVNRATLRADHYATLDSIINLMVDNPTLVVRISGHTDNTGNEAHNQRLSTNRAKVVAEYLVGNGIAENRVSFEGFGSTKPIAPNTTTVGRGKNRRVEMLLHDRRE